jgi:hypothetical protein
MRYNGSNNGRIAYSVREAAKALNVSFQTAMRSLQLLQDRGFIVCTRKGAFSLKAAPSASEWRLTEYANDTPPEHPTKDFMRWQPAEPDLPAPPKSKTRLSRRKRAFPPEKPHGCRAGNVSAKKASDGCRDLKRKRPKSPVHVSTRTTPTVTRYARQRRQAKRTRRERRSERARRLVFFKWVAAGRWGRPMTADKPHSRPPSAFRQRDNP